MFQIAKILLFIIVVLLVYNFIIGYKDAINNKSNSIVLGFGTTETHKTNSDGTLEPLTVIHYIGEINSRKNPVAASIEFRPISSNTFMMKSTSKYTEVCKLELFDKIKIIFSIPIDELINFSNLEKGDYILKLKCPSISESWGVTIY